MTKHIHAELIHAWADGAEIELCIDGNWGHVIPPSWDETYAYRIKPETVTINGFEVPAPLKVFPSHDVTTFVESPWMECFFCGMHCNAPEGAELRYLDRGLLHATKENAVASCKARLGIDPYKDNEDA